MRRRKIKVSVGRRLVAGTVVRLRVNSRWAVRLRKDSVRLLASSRWAVLRWAASARRRIKGSDNNRVFRNNNSRWEWEELQCKVVRECKRRRVECSRIRVALVVR